MRRIVSTLTLLTITFAVFAQNDKFTGALLWKISGKDMAQPSYILGTHHMTSSDFVDQIPGLRDVLSSVEQVVGEMEMGDQQGMATQMQMAAMMPADVSYKGVLTEKEYSELDEALKGLFGAGLDQFGIFKPGMISSMLAIQLFAMISPDFNPMTFVGIDTYVQQEALANDKEVKGLENIEDQLYVLFEAEPLESQIKSLHCSLNNLESMKETTVLLTKYYQEANLAKMYDLAFNSKNEPCPSSDEYEYAINKQRNDKWLVKIPFMIKSTPTLIAVGALHICGEEGLLYQLAKMGYTVEPVK